MNGLIENYTSSSSAELIYGNELGNLLIGTGTGGPAETTGDTIHGGLGNDAILGG